VADDQWSKSRELGRWHSPQNFRKWLASSPLGCTVLLVSVHASSDALSNLEVNNWQVRTTKTTNTS